MKNERRKIKREIWEKKLCWNGSGLASERENVQSEVGQRLDLSLNNMTHESAPTHTWNMFLHWTVRLASVSHPKLFILKWQRCALPVWAVSHIQGKIERTFKEKKGVKEPLQQGLFAFVKRHLGFSLHSVVLPLHLCVLSKEEKKSENFRDEQLRRFSHQRYLLFFVMRFSLVVFIFKYYFFKYYFWW